MPTYTNSPTTNSPSENLITNGAIHVITNSNGGASAVTTLLSAVTATGAGSAVGGGKATYQASGTTSSGAGAATILVQGSNNNSDWLTIGTITLTLATTSSSDGFVSDTPWAYVRGNCTAISGTGAAVTLTKAV